MISFFWVAMIWALLGVGASLFGVPREEALRAAGWFSALYLISVADLYSISKLVSAVLDLIAERTEKRIPRLIQASYWGFLKLGCLGIFTVLVLRGHEIPAVALLMGVGTMVFVPLVGGYWWSMRCTKGMDLTGST